MYDEYADGDKKEYICCDNKTNITRSPIYINVINTMVIKENHDYSSLKDIYTPFTFSYVVGGNSLSELFQDNEVLRCSISDWNVSYVIDMDYMFSNSTISFPKNIFNKTFKNKLNDSHKLFNFGISQWDVSNATSMEETFCDSAITCNLINWNTKSVCNMIRTFSRSSFNDYKFIENWNTSSVCYMMEMLSMIKLIQTIKPNWNLPIIVSMKRILYDSGINLDMSNLNLSNLQYFHG
jgi:hypothetical protein